MSLISGLFALFVLTFCLCLESGPLNREIGSAAKRRFCSQRYFDSLAFDGNKFKFTVNRKVVNHASLSPHYAFEEFKLKYNKDSKSYLYESRIVEHENLIPLGGFYIDKLHFHVEFYRNLSPNCPDTKSLSFCLYRQPSLSSECTSNKAFFKNPSYTRQNLCEWRFENDTCQKGASDDQYQQVEALILPPDVSKHLMKREHPCAFVFDPLTEKVLYVFSDKVNPIVVNSLRIMSSSHGHWFTKDIRPYRMYKFVGAFNWQTASNSSIIFLMAQSQWKRDDTVLLQLTDTSKFKLESKPIFWKAFFGCDWQFDESQPWKADKRTLTNGKEAGDFLNVYTICIIALATITVGASLFALIRNANLSSVKHFFQRVWSI